MTKEANNELAKLISQHAVQNAGRQLGRLPAFALPQDTPDVFQELLTKLDNAHRAEPAAASRMRTVSSN
jgi:hypothetical protein